MVKRTQKKATVARTSADSETSKVPNGAVKIAVLPDAVETNANVFPIVGIGASAGGLAAFESFFSGMPADDDPGMAFVLVQHLAPDHKSILTDLVKRYTRMQVFEVEDGMVVRPNCTYIIPPNRDMAFLGGTLQLLEPSSPRGQRLPIDFFFRSLAQDQHERAIGIVLSGTGSDGTVGVRAIKDEGGMVMAQDPDSTEYGGMPRSAIASGLVDFILPPAQMPAQLVAYTVHAFGRMPQIVGSSPWNNENALKKIFVLLRSHTGHDFSLYKPSTINRRIERRMALQQIETMGSYVKYAQQTPREVEALFAICSSVSPIFSVILKRLKPLKTKSFRGYLPIRLRAMRSASGYRDAPPERKPIPSPFYSLNTRSCRRKSLEYRYLQLILTVKLLLRLEPVSTLPASLLILRRIGWLVFFRSKLTAAATAFIKPSVIC